MTKQEPASASPSPPAFLPGVDTLRFIAAAWVTIGHGVLDPISHWAAANLGIIGRVIHLGLSVIGGGAPVAVFFVLSGLCIHYPNVNKERIDLSRYFTKRMLRILPPLLCAVLLADLLGPAYRDFFGLALWSVYCEVVYYVLYPLFIGTFHRRGVMPVLLGTCLISFVMLLFKPGALALWEFGGLTWLYCAPLWLVGAWCAERVVRQAPSLPGSVWFWRGAMIVLAPLIVIAATHFPILIGLPWTVIPLGFCCIGWVLAEIAHRAHTPAPTLFEKMGLACYSSYLMHTLALVLARRHFANGPILVELFAPLVCVVAMSVAFYLVVEHPSHRLAYKLGKRVSRPSFSIRAVDR